MWIKCPSFRYAGNQMLFYRPKRSFGQGNIFTLSVILFTGGEGSGKVWKGELPHPPRAWRTPPPWRTPPGPDPPDQTPPLAWRAPLDQTPPQHGDPLPPNQTPPRHGEPPRPDTPGMETPPGSRLRHTVYDRPVRILLECILVCNVTTVAGRL